MSDLHHNHKQKPPTSPLKRIARNAQAEKITHNMKEWDIQISRINTIRRTWKAQNVRTIYVSTYKKKTIQNYSLSKESIKINIQTMIKLKNIKDTTKIIKSKQQPNTWNAPLKKYICMYIYVYIHVFVCMPQILEMMQFPR